MADKIEQNKGYGSTESEGQAAASSTPPPAEDNQEEKEMKKTGK